MPAIVLSVNKSGKYFARSSALPKYLRGPGRDVCWSGRGGTHEPDRGQGCEPPAHTPHPTGSAAEPPGFSSKHLLVPDGPASSLMDLSP